MVEVVLEHYGLEADEAAVTFFVCLFPVALDVYIKFWVCLFRLINRDKK